MADWMCGASRNLPIASDAAWDGGAAEASIFEWAGGDDFSSEKARKGFLAYDASAPDKRGSYKLPFALISNGSLKASPAGIRAAASRLPQADIPSDVKTKAEAVIDHYEEKMGIGDHAHDGDSDRDDGKSAPVFHKMFTCPEIKATETSNSALEMINRLTPEPVTQEHVWTGKMKLANDQYDRDDERFPRSYLNRFAETLPGKSVMVGHDYSKAPVGRFYDAEIKKSDGATHVIGHFFMDADGEHTPAVRKGVMGHVSVGFQGDTRMCDICDKDYDGAYKGYYSAKARGTSLEDEETKCNHIKGVMYNGVKCTATWGGDAQKAEAQEGSFVWLGSQRGAQMTRGTSADQHKAAWIESLAEIDNGKENSMDETQKAAAAEREKALQVEIERLKPLAADGEAYRKYLKSEIARLHTSMGEESTGAALLDALSESGAAKLDGVRKDADARHAKAFARGGAELQRIDPSEVGIPEKRTLNEILFGARGGG